MNISPFILAVLSLLVVLGTVAQYFSTIPRGKVPVKPIGLISFLSLGILIALIAIFKSFTGSILSIVAVIITSAISLFMGFGILWLLTQRKTPIGEIKVKVGDKFLSFETLASDGVKFNSDELFGKRTLLKFYRGGWCPYCSAELQLFEKMTPELQKYSIDIVALSKDSVEEAAIHKNRDSLNFRLLSDPTLKVIRQYWVEHHKALGSTTWNFTILGIPFALDLSFKAMAIPTSLLIDEKGVIQWVNQSEDYRLRASNTAVLQAVKDAFGK